ncbi:MAG TPA: diguanylate cyclase [Lichenihabitans sp.]|jgi:diguanylate cyclase (GGDEF)-like protein|nr:diguanylate cyclase [Lichenihabitans sp.]
MAQPSLSGLSSDPCVAALLAAGLCSTGIGLSLYDAQDNLIFAGGNFALWFDVEPGPQSFATIMRRCHRLGRGPLFTLAEDAWLAMAQTKRRSAPFRRFEVDMVDGSWLMVTEATFPDGALLSTFADITALKTNEKALRYAHDLAVSAAETDWLTGAPNRRRMMRRLGDLAALGESGGRLFSIGLVDLDHFKAVNDTYGHDFGDAVLRTFAEAGRASVRREDMFGRVGGEEFMVIVSGPQGDAEAVLGRLRTRLAHSRRNGLQGVSCTFSAGIAGWRPGDSVDALYRRADQALYAAKRSGRNQVSLAKAG